MIALRPRDGGYPASLRDLRHPPDPLFVEGDLGDLDHAVAIVGTRRMTGYGERVARELAMACAAVGIVVVSGLAQGVDSAAHRGALDGGGRTIAVLGESIPAFLATVRGRRRPLAPRIRAGGALVSEYAAPFVAKPWMFAQRNATIAALASTVVVVEAGEVSGALITADRARELGRTLYAVPGPIGSAASVGTNRLIAGGLAKALTSASDLTGRAAIAAPSDAVLDLPRDGPLGLDEIARRGGMTSVMVTARVAMLLLRGEVLSLPDGRLRRA
ncbi:MAG TPA: DNA-processing protein DprA [Candidatus Acidoferrales bacterium]|nr:DNA-processing protein DprA [Candidatus Acidoferrales bacterium]